MSPIKGSPGPPGWPMVIGMVGRRLLALVIGLATVVALFVLVRRAGGSHVGTVISHNWAFLLGALAIAAAVQPLRASAWATTLRQPIGFRAVFAASAVGSFLDTVLPGRLGEASKVGVLKVAAGRSYPGFSRAGGSLLCAHLLEMVAFAVVGAGAAIFLPLPLWARITCVVGLLLTAGGLVLAAALHRRIGARLPRSVASFLAGAAAPRRVMLRAGAILLVTWVARWFSVLLCLHALDVHVGVGAALLYMVVTGLANTMPFLPGNIGLYQGAAIGALAMVGQAGAKAAAVSLLMPVMVSIATAAAAAIALAFYGRRFVELSRAAFVRI